MKNPPANAGDVVSTSESGRASGEGNGVQPILVFLPGKSHGRRPWRATVHGMAKSQI